MNRDGGIYIINLIKQLKEYPEWMQNRITAKVLLTTPYWKRIQIEADTVDPKILTQKHSGEVVRTIMKVFGKPNQNYLRPHWRMPPYLSEQVLGYRKVIWAPKWHTYQKNFLKLKRLEDRKEIAITEYSGFIVLHIHESCYVSSFYHSTKPEVWKKLHKKTHKKFEDMKKRKAVVKALDGIADGH